MTDEQAEPTHHGTRSALAAPGTPGDQLRPSRRIVFNGLAALGVAAALAGCGSDTTGGATSTPTKSNSKSKSGSGSGSGLQAGTELAKTGDVPVNGGVILPDHKVVITQEKSGSFKAFTAVCTHAGFLVTSVEGDQIKCRHHGSRYDATTGAVLQGPAPASLAPVAITVRGGSILTA